jgi:hypothetical protein
MKTIDLSVNMIVSLELTADDLFDMSIQDWLEVLESLISENTGTASLPCGAVATVDDWNVDS